ncbi:MAG: Fe-S cluster assembly protein SufB, partial [Finegoldia magna]|nr:Fe-S cluster assembly protein SufB [Finegoldia magna]
MAPKKKTQVDEMDRGIYDIKNKFTFRRKTEEGLTPEIVRQISEEKNEPQWMLEKRLEALEIFYHSEDPEWGPDLSVVDMNKVTTYIRPDADRSSDWNEVPDEIRDTFDKLGIQEA